MDLGSWFIVSACIILLGMLIVIGTQFFKGTRAVGWEYGGHILVVSTIVALVVFGVGFGIFTLTTDPCPNPNCDARIENSYCQECGWGADATMDCPTCEKHFDTDKIPAFCPDCGTELKYEKKHCTECGKQIGVDDKFCASCGSAVEAKD